MFLHGKEEFIQVIFGLDPKSSSPRSMAPAAGCLSRFCTPLKPVLANNNNNNNNNNRYFDRVIDKTAINVGPVDK